MKECENCYWNGECSDDKVCSYYTPLDDEKDIIDKYKMDLAERAREYQDLIDEQNA